MNARAGTIATALWCLAPLVLLPSCAPNPPITPLKTTVGRSVATLVKTSGIELNTNCEPMVPPAPDYRAEWNAMSPTSRGFPFAGFELWRNSTPGCTQSRLDTYHALVTFNMAAVSRLKGLIQRAELVVDTYRKADSAGTVVTLGPLGTTSAVNATCPSFLGGGGSVQRFSPAGAASLPPLSSAPSLIEFQGTANPFPMGTTVYTFPARLNPGPVPGATSPTTVGASGNAGAVFVTDVTNTVNAALNGNHAGLSYTITSVFEGPLPFVVPAGRRPDCRTAYDIRLELTHY